MKEGRRRGIWRVVALVLAVLLIVESMPLNALAAAYHRYSTAGNNSYIPLVSSQDDDDGWDEEDRDGDLIDDRDLSALGTLSLGWNNRLASGSNEMRQAQAARRRIPRMSMTRRGRLPQTAIRTPATTLRGGAARRAARQST